MHERVDTLVGIFMSFVGEVEVDHGGFESRVPQVELDEAEVHPSFKQMGGVRMSARFDIMLYLMDNGTASRC